jgi:hypothetical protein
MKANDHPPHCRACHGTGWEEADRHGRHGHSTYRPCQHHWSNDNPTPDETIPWSDPRAQPALARGYVQGIADLGAMQPERTVADA